MRIGGVTFVNWRKIVLSLAAASTVFSGAVAHAQGISLLRDAEMEKFLEDYSHPIFRAAGLDENSIEILIVNDGSFNAFAGGRYMGVNTGMLTTIDTPNQMEAVIAHEAGHLAGGHSARSQDAASKASRSMILGLVLAGAAIAAGAPEAGMAALGFGQQVGIANYLRYSRGQEATADQSSITYLDKLGHSSKGALELWRKMRNSQIISGQRINPYYQSHPLANERLTALQQRAEASPYYGVEDTEESITRLRYIQAKIRGFLHDPNSTLRYYPLTDQSGPAHYARAVAYYRLAHIDKALSEVRALTADQPENPYFHELEGQMLFEFGRADEAIEPHRLSVKYLSDNALLRINLGRALLGSLNPANREEAVKELKRALFLEPENSFGWFELARAYGELGDEPMALLATAESRYHAGASTDASQFARRAIARLKQGSPEWRRAADIIRVTQPDGEAPLMPEAAPEAETARPQPSPTRDGGDKRPDVPDPLPSGANRG